MSPQTSRKRPDQRIVSIHLPFLPTDRIARQTWGRSWLLSGRPDAPPIIIAAKTNNALRIVAHEADGAKHGFFCGQPLGDARALIPDLECIEQDAKADRHLLVAVAGWCDRYTPLVALDGYDGLFLDITGCAHLFGGESAMLNDIIRRLTLQGLQPKVCAADTAGAAWAMARHGKMQNIAAGDVDPVLSLPLAALRIGSEIAVSLARVGLRTIGCIAYMPRAPLAARFGQDLIARLDQALGRSGESLSFLRPAAALTSEKRFAEPISQEDDVRRVIQDLASSAIPLLEKRGEGARRIALKFFRVDGEIFALEVHAANPLRDAGRIAAMFDERLAALKEDFDAGYGFDLMRFEIIQAEPLADKQEGILSKRQSGDSLDALIDRLGARLGTDRVSVFAYADTHIPKRRFGLVPAVLRRVQNGHAPEHKPGPITRPLWLLDRPEPLEVIAEVPDGPPLRFRWRKVHYAVQRSEGPERIACEWWRDGRAAMSRDYYKVEDEAGHRFWLFRHGLYGRETDRPRWYMYGLFS
ncbi:MAG: DNA polymerase Y family protein [Hyphomicrobiales bacterium]|nr:DNA polymerase Y family protein [Hyphomicrobiales bacterium]